MKKVPVIILAGQSNAVGIGHSEYLTKTFPREKIDEWKTGYADILVDYDSQNMCSNGFVPVKIAPTSPQEGGDLGPEVGMADYLNAHHPGEKFYIIKWAYCNTRLYNDWSSPSRENYCPDADPTVPGCRGEKNIGWCYNGLITLMKESITRLAAMGLEPDFRAFCWMQGESDAWQYAYMTETYHDNFNCLMKDLRAEFGELLQNCRVVDAGISCLWPLYQTLNDVKKILAKENGHVYLDTLGAGLTTGQEPAGTPDAAHYDAASYITLGRMFAQAALGE